MSNKLKNTNQVVVVNKKTNNLNKTASAISNHKGSVHTALDIMPINPLMKLVLKLGAEVLLTTISSAMDEVEDEIILEKTKREKKKLKQDKKLKKLKNS